MARASLKDDLEEQVEVLRKEIARLQKSLSKSGARAYDEASETAGAFYEDMAERWADAMPVIRKRARYVEKQARDNPGTTAAVTLVVVGLLATMLFRR